MYSVAVVTRLMGAEDAFVRCMFRISVAKTKVLQYAKFNGFSNTLVYSKGQIFPNGYLISPV